MNKLRDPKIQGQLRHLLTALGPVVAVLVAIDASGVATPAEVWRALLREWPAMVGFLMAGLGFWASWTAKEKS